MAGRKRKIRKLKARVRELRRELAAVRQSAPGVSPLAPPDGFQSLPTVRGAEFSSVAAGVRYSGRADVMLARTAPGSTVAGVFTQSTTRSAPVRDCEVKLAGLAGGTATGGLAILVNSGNANAFTGRDGDATVSELTGQVARTLGIPQGSVFSASTGVIGEKLPAEVISGALDELVAGLDPGRTGDAARAIMTTDTFPKGSGTSFVLGDRDVAVFGFAKGSGMIAPDMATMLAFIFTDATVSQGILQGLVSEICGRTFNSITVDSDTSTSDTVLVVATGAAGAPAIDDVASPACARLAGALESVMTDLAQQIVRDGEGATKFVEVNATGAASVDDARRVAFSIANSPLVKTAIAGEDPNWGRVVMAVGKSGAQADRDLLSIRFGDIEVAECGEVSKSHSEELAAAYMRNSEIVISVDLGLGEGSAKVWTCDFSAGYVAVNADYRS